MDYVEKCMEVLGLEIYGMKFLWKNCYLKMVVEFKFELDEFIRIQIFEIERVIEGICMKFVKISVEIDVKLRLYKIIICNENLYIMQSIGVFVLLFEKGICFLNFVFQFDDFFVRIFEFESLYVMNFRKLVNIVVELKKFDMEKFNLVE